MIPHVEILSNKEEVSTIKIKLPSADVDSKIRIELKDLSKTMSVRGFRPGKIPFEVVSKLAKEEVLKEVLVRESVNDINQYFASQDDIVLYSAPTFLNAVLNDGFYEVSMIANIIDVPNEVKIDSDLIIEVSKENKQEVNPQDLLIKFAASNSNFLEKKEVVEPKVVVILSEINGIKLVNNLVVLLDETKKSIHDYYGKKSGDLITISFDEYTDLKKILFTITELEPLQDIENLVSIECKMHEICKVIEDKVTVEDIIDSYKLDKRTLSEEDLSSPQNLLLSLHSRRSKALYEEEVDKEIVKFINSKTGIVVKEELALRFLELRVKHFFGIDEVGNEPESIIEEIISTLAFSIFALKLVKNHNLSANHSESANISNRVVMGNYYAYLYFERNNPSTSNINDFFMKNRDILNDDIRMAINRFLAIEYIKKNATLKLV